MIKKIEPNKTTLMFEVPEKLLEELEMLAGFLNLRTDELIIKILEKYAKANSNAIKTTLNMETKWLKNLE